MCYGLLEHHWSRRDWAARTSGPAVRIWPVVIMTFAWVETAG
jgi:hypothetical protein